LPAQRGEDGNQRVSKRVQLIGIAFEDIERKRDIDGKPSYVEGKLEFVAIVDVSIEVGESGGPRNSIRIRWWDF
jgi:hypothetical protein